MHNDSLQDTPLTRAHFVKGIRAAARLTKGGDPNLVDFANNAARLLAQGAVKSGYITENAWVPILDNIERDYHGASNEEAQAVFLDALANLIENGDSTTQAEPGVATATRKETAESFFKLGGVLLNHPESTELLGKLRMAAVVEGLLDRGVATQIEEEMLAAYPVLTADAQRELAERLGDAVLTDARSDEPLNVVIARDLRVTATIGQSANIPTDLFLDGVQPFIEEAFDAGFLSVQYAFAATQKFDSDRAGCYAWALHLAEVIRAPINAFADLDAKADDEKSDTDEKAA